MFEIHAAKVERITGVGVAQLRGPAISGKRFSCRHRREPDRPARSRQLQITPERPLWRMGLPTRFLSA
jgi:hypothetical protein